MTVQRSVRIDAEIATVGQFNQTETFVRKRSVERLEDGRVRIGDPTQSGFEWITFRLDDLLEAVKALGEEHNR